MRIIHIFIFPKLSQDQGIVECQKTGSRRSVNYGYGELLEAAVYEKDGTTLVEKTTKVEMLHTLSISKNFSVWQGRIGLQG